MIRNIDFQKVYKRRKTKNKYLKMSSSKNQNFLGMKKKRSSENANYKIKEINITLDEIYGKTIKNNNNVEEYIIDINLVKVHRVIKVKNDENLLCLTRKVEDDGEKLVWVTNTNLKKYNPFILLDFYEKRLRFA